MIENPSLTTPASSEAVGTTASTPKADWIVAALRGTLPKSLDEVSQLGLSVKDFDLNEDPEAYWSKSKVRQQFTGEDGKERRDVFDQFYNEAKKAKNEFHAAEMDKENSGFFQVGAQSYLDKFTNSNPFTIYSKRTGVIDPWGRNENFGVFSEKRWGLLEKASDNGVKLPSGQYVSPDDFDGHVKVAKDENGAFLFDDKGLPYFVPVQEGEELKQSDVVYNGLAKKMGFYGHDYDMWNFLGSFVKAPINFVSSTLDSFAEIPKVLVQAVDDDNAFVKGVNNFQQDMKGIYIPMTEEGQESLWTFENGLDSLQQVAYQLLSMWATGGASAAITGSAKVGSLASRGFMLGMTLGPVSEMSKENGLSPQEAALMMLASAPFLYAAQGLSDKLVRGIDPTRYKAGIKQILMDEYKVIQAEGLNPATARSLLYNTRTKIGDMVTSLSKLPAVAQGAALEGIEESGEQLVDLASRLGYNLSQGHFTDADKGKKKGFQIDWMNELNQLGFAGTMGAFGGAIGKGLINRFDKEIPDFQRSVIDIFAQGNGDKLYKFLDDVQTGKAGFSFDAKWLNQNGKPVQPGEPSRNEVIVHAIRSMAKYAEEIVGKSGLKEAIRNNEAVAGQMREALKNSNIGADYTNLLDAKLKLQEKIETFDPATGNKDDKASWQEQIAIIDKDLEEIKLTSTLPKYLEEGMYNTFVLNKKASPYLTGKDFWNLNRSRKEVLGKLNQQITEHNEKLALRDQSVTLADFHDGTKGAFTEAGKQKLLSEFEAYVTPKLQQVAASVEAINQVLDPDEGPGYDPAAFTDMVASIQQVRNMHGDDINLIRGALPDVAALIEDIVKDSKMLEDLSGQEVAEVKPAAAEDSPYLAMTDQVTIGQEKMRIPNPIPIEDKVLEEEIFLEKGSKDGVSMYTADDRVKKILDSIRARKAQIESINEVATAINPTKLKKGDEQIPLLAEERRKGLLENLADLERRAVKLQETSDTNAANSELRISQAMSKFLAKTLDSLESIGDAMNATDYQELASIIGKYVKPLAEASRTSNNDEFLKVLLKAENEIYSYGQQKGVDQILKTFADTVGEQSYSQRTSADGVEKAKAYDLLRGILAISSSEVVAKMQEAVKASSKTSLNPTVQQTLIAVRAVQNMIAGEYLYPGVSKQARRFSYTTMIDSDPGAGKTTVEAALIAGVMQRITGGKVWLTAQPDSSANERKNNLEKAVNGFYHTEGSTTAGINLTNFSGSVVDFIKSSVAADTSLIVFDEATLLSDEELDAIAIELNKINTIRSRQKDPALHLLMLGDSFQKTVTSVAGDGDETNGVSNPHGYAFPRTERIDFSFRVQNQALKALNDYFKDIQVVGKKPAPYFEYQGEKGARIFNDKSQFYTHVTDVLTKAKTDGAIGQYMYITDTPTSIPTAILASGVQVMTPEQAQGKERKYVIVDLSDTQVFADESKLPLKQSYYTAFTRAGVGVITFFPADQGLFSREGKVMDIKPLTPQAASKEQFLERLNAMLDGYRSMGGEYKRKPFTVSISDELFPKGSKVPGEKVKELTKSDAQVIAELIDKANSKNSMTGWTFVTPVPEGSTLERQVELKKKFLYDTDFAESASYQLVISKIGSPRMSEITPKYGKKKDVMGTYGIFLEGTVGNETVTIAALDASNAKAIAEKFKLQGEDLVVPLNGNPMKYASKKHPYILNHIFDDQGGIKKQGDRLTLKEIKQSAPPGIAFSKVFVATSDKKTTGIKLINGVRYVAMSFKHTQEQLNQLLENGDAAGNFDDPAIQYHELDKAKGLDIDATLKNLEQYMTDLTHSNFSEEGYKINNAVWGYLSEPEFTATKNAILEGMKRNNVNDKPFVEFIERYAKGRFEHLLKNLVGFRKRKLLSGEDKTNHQNLERFFQEIKKLPYFTTGDNKGFIFNPRLQKHKSAPNRKQNPYGGFAVEFENKEIYDNLLSDISGGVTYPAIQFNKKEIEAMVAQAEAFIAAPAPMEVRKEQVIVTNPEAPTAAKTEVPSPVREENNMTPQQFFNAVFKDYESNWFSESKKKFKKEVYDSIYVLKGDAPKINTLDAAIKAARANFDAKRSVVKLEEFQGKSPNKDIFVDNVLSLHFDWYLSQYFPAIKQITEGEASRYIIRNKYAKSKENYERDNFSLLDEGISQMVWTQLENTPILETVEGKLVESGDFLNQSHIEELVDALRGVYTQRDYENRMRNHPSEAVKSFYYRFLHDSPYKVGSTVRHSFNALKDVEDGVYVKTAVLAAIRSGEIYRMAYVDLQANTNKIPGSNAPNNIKQIAVEGVKAVITAGNVRNVNGVITIDGQDFKKAKSYTDEEVVDAFQGIGIPLFTDEILQTLINKDALNKSGRDLGNTSERTKSLLMEEIFFKLATLGKDADFAKVLTPQLNIVLRAIQRKYGVNSTSDINMDGEKENRLRRTASIFSLEDMRFRVQKDPDHLLRDNLVINDFYKVSSPNTGLLKGIRKDARKSKSNSALSTEEMMEYIMYWNFKSVIDKDSNKAFLPFVPFADSGSDLAHIISMGEDGKSFLRDPKEIATALFGSRMHYYNKLEQDILKRWAVATGKMEPSLARLKSRLLVAGEEVTSDQIKAQGLHLYKNLDYIPMKGSAHVTIKDELIRKIEQFRDESKLEAFLAEMEAGATRLIEQTKQVKDSAGKTLYSKMGSKQYASDAMIRAFHYNWVAYSTEMDHIFNGPISQYKGSTEMEEVVDNNKRARNSTSNGAVMVFRDENWNPQDPSLGNQIEGAKLPKNILVAYVSDFKKPVRDYSFTTHPDDLFQELFDGMTFVNPAMRVAQRASFGGDYGTSITPVQKNITGDISKGIKTLIKNADSAITARRLRIGTDKFRERYRKMLSIPFPQGNTLGAVNALEVLSKMGVDVQNFSNVEEQHFEKHYKTLVQHGLQDFMIMEIVPDTSAKTGLPNINDPDAPSYVPSQLDITNRYNLLDASKDPSGGMMTTILSQYINAVGINNQEPHIIQRILNGLSLIANNYITDVATKDTKEFFQKILQKSIEGRDDFTYQTLAIQSGKFSLQDRQIFNKAVSALNSEISDNAVSIQFQGGQYIVHPQAEIFEVYELADGNIRLRDQAGWETGKSRDLKWEDPIHKATNRRLTDFYNDIYKLDPSKWSEAKRVLDQSLATEEWSQGYAEIVAPADMAKEFYLQEALAANLPIELIDEAYFAKVIAENNLKTTANHMLQAFQRRLEGIHVRIPTTGKHSAVRTRIVAFADDAMNSVFVPKEYLFVQGADQDIDKGNYLTVQSYKGRIPMATENFTLLTQDKAIFDGIKDPEEKRFFKTMAIKNRIAQDLMHLTGTSKNLVERNTPVKVVMGPWKAVITKYELDKGGNGKAQLSKDDFFSYAQAHQTNQAGKAMVGIFANGQKAYQVLYQYLKTTGLPSPIAGLEGVNNVWFRYSGLINAATDNAKEQILGMLGINMSNGYLVNYLVAAGYNEDQIYEFMRANQGALKMKERVERFDSNLKFSAKMWSSFPELYKVHKLAEEFNLLSTTIFNTELPNSTEDMHKVKFKVERFIDRAFEGAKIKQNKFNFIDFINDENYANAWIQQYERLLPTGNHAFNLLRVYKEVPHVRAYLRAYGFAYSTLQRNSSIFQTSDAVMEVVKENLEMPEGSNEHTFEDIGDEGSIFFSASDKIPMDKIRFRDINDFVYGMAIDGYFKYKGGKFEDIEEDLSIPEGRKKFVTDFYNSLPMLKKQYKGNQFINMVGKSARGKANYPLLRMPDVMTLNEESMLEVRHAFSKLPETLQQKVFLYSLITSKDKPGKGALNQIFDPAIKSSFIDFLDRFPPIIASDLKEEQISRIMKQVVTYAEDPYNTWINYESRIRPAQQNEIPFSSPAQNANPVMHDPALQMGTQEEDHDVPQTDAERMELGGYIVNMQTMNGGDFDKTLTRWFDQLNTSLPAVEAMLDSVLKNKLIKRDAGGVMDYVRDFAKNYFSKKPATSMKSKPSTKNAEQFLIHEDNLNLIAKAVKVYSHSLGFTDLTEKQVLEQFSHVKNLSYMHGVDIGVHPQRLNMIMSDIWMTDSLKKEFTPAERVRLSDILIEIRKRKEKLSEQEVKDKAKACGIIKLFDF